MGKRTEWEEYSVIFNKIVKMALQEFTGIPRDRTTGYPV
jgi:hypothetical protein